MCSWCYASNCTGYVKIIGGFCKTIFSQLLNRNTRCYYHLKEKYLQFHSDLKCIRCAPLVWHGRCPGDTPNPAKPSQACLVWRFWLRCWCALAVLVVSLEVVGCKHCPWRNPTERNHTLSGLVTGVARCRRCCLCPLHDQPIDLAGVHLGTLRPPYANVVGPNEHLPGRWVGRAADKDNTFCTWPPRSPDLTVCDFFLCGFVKDNVYVPTLPKTLPELRERINTTIGNVTQDMLERVWQEWEYRLDICRIKRGAHIECI